MDTKIFKNEEQYQLLVSRFNELRQEDPELESFRVLTRVVMGGGYNARTITRGVNNLVDVRDFCTDSFCRGCASHYDKESLKHWLHHLACPAVLKMKHYTVEEIRKVRKEEIVN